MNTNKITPTVEEKADNKGFFTKRNVIILILTTILSLSLVFVTLYVVFDPSIWGTFFINIHEGIKVNFGVLWLSILIAFGAFNIVYNIIPIWLRLKQLGIKIKAWQWFCFALSISFMKAVTPANFIYDPYTIFWLKTQGVSTSRATSLLVSNAFMWQSAVLLIHIPSFIIVLTHANELISVMDNPAAGVSLIIFMSIGIIIDTIGVLVMVLLCFSTKAHYQISRLFNWFKKKLHLKYHSKAEIEEKYKNKAVLKREITDYYKDWATSLIALFVLVSYELVVYFTLSASMSLINAKSLYSFDPIYVFHSANMAFNANRLNLIPGFGVGLEASLWAMLKALGGGISGPADGQKTFIQQSIVLWRAFYTYLPAIVGLFGFGGLTAYQVRSYKKNKKLFVQNKDE